MKVRFGDHQLDTRAFEVTGPDGTVPLEPKSYALLKLLIEQRARTVPKDEIFETVWPGIHVTDSSLSTAVKQLRAALGDDGERQAVIKTVRGVGFRFVAEAVEEDAAAVARAAQAQSMAQAADRSGEKPTLAIRPFGLIGSDMARDAIAEAIPAELIATLSRLRWINVIARASSFKFGADTTDTAQMGQDLGARYVVSGLVEWMGPRLALYVELSDARSGQIIWSDRLSGPLSDIYDLRARAARDLTTALELRLPTHEAERLRHVPSENLDAWGHYHLGMRHMYRYNQTDNQIAAYHFQNAIDLDPAFARAHSGLSYTAFQNAFQHFERDTAYYKNEASRHADEAMRLDDHDPFCNLILGRAKWLSGAAEEGLVWVDRALAMNPNYAFGHYNHATLNTVLCNGALADQHVHRALTLSPMDPNLQSMFGTRALAAFVSDDGASALRHADQSLLAPNPHLYVYMIAAAVFNRYGQPQKARQCVDRMRARNAPFGKAEFLAHFNLRDPERLTLLLRSLDDLGV